MEMDAPSGPQRAAGAAIQGSSEAIRWAFPVPAGATTEHMQPSLEPECKLDTVD